MYRSILPAVFLLLLHAAELPAQVSCTLQLKGQVLETHNFNPLYPVTVYVTELGKVYHTGESGYFLIDSLCPGNYTLHFQLMGYEGFSRQIALTESSAMKFRMSHAEHQLAGITVKQERNPTIIQSKDRMSRDELSRNSGRTLGDMLQAVNGVSVLGNGATIAKPVIHGLHSNRIVMLNNGIRQEDQQWGGEHAPNIDPFLANTVTVVKGAAGVRYGTDAMGGVILVEPGPLRNHPGWNGEVNLAGFSNNRMGVASAMLEHNFRKIPALSFRVQGTVKRGGNYRIPGYWAANTGVSERNFSATLGWKKAHYGAELFYSRFSTQIGIYRGAHTGSKEDLDRAIRSPYPLVPATAGYKIGRPMQHVTHDLLKARWYGDNRLGVWSLTYAWQHNFRQEYDVLRKENEKAQLNLTLNTQTVNLNLDHKALGPVTGQVGVDGLYQDNFFRNGDRLFIPSYQSAGAGGYLIERWKKRDWTVEAGTRYDYRNYQVANPEGNHQQIVHYNFDFSNVSATLGTRYQPEAGGEWALTLSRAWRAPQANELFSAGLHHGAARVELGNKDLVPERSFNINLEHRHTWKNRLIAEVSLYRQYISDYIYLEPGADLLTIRGYFKTFSYVQTDALLTGMDASLRYKWNASFSSDMRASVLRARDRNTDDWLILMPSDRFSIGSRYSRALSPALQECFIGLNGRYVLQQHRIPRDFDRIDYPRPPGGYFLLNIDMGTKLTVRRQPLYLGLSVMNALNARYRDYLDAFRYFIDQPGWNAVLRIRVPFDF